VFCVTLQSKLSHEAIPAYDQIFYISSGSVTKPKAPKAKVARTKVAETKVVGTKVETPVAPKKETKLKVVQPVASKTMGVKKAAAKPTPLKPAAKKVQPVARAAVAPLVGSVTGPTVAQILLAVPQLKSGDWLLFRDIAKVLHDKKLLAKNATSPKLFKKFPTQFELEPVDKPQKVRWMSAKV
jgi:hypothetical protein